MCSIEHKAEDTCIIHHNGGKDEVETNRKTLDDKTISNSLVKPSGAQEASVIEKANSPNNSTTDHDFPEGGIHAWLVVFGCSCGMTAVFGVINSTAVFQQYLSTHQLLDYSASQIGWIFSFGLFMTFLGGVQVGPIFDARGPRLLLLAGSALLFLSMMLLGECTEYWHFFIVYGLLNGLGGALVSVPAVAAIGHYFLIKRGTAIGIAYTGGSIGGIVFPLMLQSLLPAVGFAWSTRILAFVLLLLIILANLLIRTRLPPSPAGRVLPDFGIFKDSALAFCTLGLFFLEWGLFVPLTYVSSYAVAHGRTTAFAFQIVSVLNAGSFFGRWLPGLLADKIGRYNTIIITITLCIVTVLALWLPAHNSEVMLILFAICFGFASGSNLSLTPVCIGQLCKTENYGRYFSTCLTFASFGTLTGLPIAGQILSMSNGSFSGLIIFAGIAYAAALACFIASRVYRVGLGVREMW